MSNDELVMIVGGAIAVILGAVDVARTNGQSLTAWGVTVLGAVFVILTLL